MMRGSEVETTVLESTATNMPTISPESAVSTARWVMGASVLVADADEAVAVVTESPYLVDHRQRYAISCSMSTIARGQLTLPD